VKNSLVILLLLLAAVECRAETARQLVRRGNDSYASKDWQGALQAYEKAIAQEPGQIIPKFNKANALFRSGDIAGALDQQRQVAAESRDLSLVAKAKYNIGNYLFEEGRRQMDSDLQKSVGSLQSAIENWRAVLELEPQNAKAHKNIEAAKLLLKQILDEQKKRQQNQDPNSAGQQNKQQDNQQQQQQQGNQGQDPNDPNQAGQQNKQQDNQQQQQQQEQKEQQEQQASQQQADEKKDAPDATAEEILRDEQDRKKQLQPGRQPGYVPVEQDW